MPRPDELMEVLRGLTAFGASALRALMPFLVAFALLLGPLMACMVVYWVRSLGRALAERRSFIVVPTSRTEKMEPRTYNTIVRSINQVRLRRRNAIMRPAGAVRVSLFNANKLAVVHAMGGPPWMAGVLDVNNVTGVVVAPVDLVDPARISPKSILPPAWVEAGDDAPTLTTGLGLGALGRGGKERA